MNEEDTILSEFGDIQITTLRVMGDWLEEMLQEWEEVTREDLVEQFTDRVFRVSLAFEAHIASLTDAEVQQLVSEIINSEEPTKENQDDD